MKLSHVTKTKWFMLLRRTVFKKHNAALTGLLLLCILAVVDFITGGFTRRTFVFQTINTGQDVVEERMLMRTKSRETDISRYVEEVILGPLSLETAPLINREAQLEALLLRNDIVYLSISEEAAISPAGGSLLEKFDILRREIIRNFPSVKEVRIFIAGNEVVLS